MTVDEVEVYISPSGLSRAAIVRRPDGFFGYTSTLSYLRIIYPSISRTAQCRPGLMTPRRWKICTGTRSLRAVYSAR